MLLFHCCESAQGEKRQHDKTYKSIYQGVMDKGGGRKREVAARQDDDASDVWYRSSKPTASETVGRYKEEEEGAALVPLPRNPKQPASFLSNLTPTPRSLSSPPHRSLQLPFHSAPLPLVTTATGEEGVGSRRGKAEEKNTGR